MTAAKSSTGLLLSLFFVSLLSRALFLSITGPISTPDTRHYLDVAQNIAELNAVMEWDGFENRLRPQTLRTPGYALYCAFFFKVLGVRDAALVGIAFSQVVIISAVTLLCYSFGLVFSRHAAILAALLCALDPWLSYTSLTILTEALFTFLLILIFLAAARALATPTPLNCAVWGLLLGMSTLVRPMLENTIVLVPIALLLVKMPFKRRLACASLAIVMFATPVTVWRLRNYALTGNAVLATHQGMSLLWETTHLVRESTSEDYWNDPVLARARDIVANTPASITQLMREQPELIRPPHGGSEAFKALRREMDLSEQAADSLMSRIALETVFRNPKAYAVRFLRNTSLFLAGIRHPVDLLWDLGIVEVGVVESLERGRFLYPGLNAAFRLVTIVFFGPLFVAGLAYGWRRFHYRRPLILYFSAIFAYHLVVVTLVAGYDRYRLPLHPEMFVFASLAAISGWEALRSRWKSNSRVTTLLSS